MVTATFVIPGLGEAGNPGPRAMGPGGEPLPTFVYLLASRRNGTLTIGVTNDLGRRVHEHKVKRHVGFTATYGVDQLAWYEAYEQVDEAIGREKMLKEWRRAWKLALIKGMNPTWHDLYGSRTSDC